MKYEIMMSILFELLSKKTVSAKYLAEKYEVSIRSIYRYINCIELAGVPLYTTRGKFGGFSIVDTYRLSSTFLSIEEYNKVLSALISFNENLPEKSLESAITKLKCNSRKDYSQINIKSGNLIIDAGPWGDAVGYKTKIKVLQECIDNKEQLFITYHDRNGDVTERIIDPYLFLFKQGIWYVYGYCNLRETFRFFKVGRIEKANKLSTYFVRKEIDSNNLPLNFWESETDSIDVELEIEPKFLSDITEWLGVENIKKENEKFVARVKLPNDDGLVSKIISYSDGIKVINPPSLREKILDTANRIKNYYN